MNSQLVRFSLFSTVLCVVGAACGTTPSGTDGGTGGGLSFGGGSTAGGSTAGGSTAGGSTAGGSTAGGSTAGGSTAGGSTAGGSTAGGSTAGGSTAGGSAFLACPAMYAGCSSYTDRTGEGATVTLSFPTVSGSPACLRLRTNQSLSITNVSGLHPLSQHCGPDQKVTGSMTSAMTLSNLQAGTYGFYCPNHGVAASGLGMGFGLQVVQ